MSRSILSLALGVTLMITLASALPAAASEASNEANKRADELALTDDVALPSPYIQATSPADAEKKFAAIEAGGNTARATSIQYGPCTLYPSVMYLRKSSNYRNVGTKPYTKCEVPVSSSNHSTDLRYKSFIWWRKATTKSGGNTGVASYTQRNVEYRCVSNESTGWSGTTAGTISYGGKKYYARVYQPVKTLACGG